MSGKPRKPSAASTLIGLGGRHVDREVLRDRFADRDQRAASDTRTPAQKILGDPAPHQSALTRRNVSSTINDLIASLAKRR